MPIIDWYAIFRLKGKPSERLGRKASGLSSAGRNKVAGLPGFARKQKNPPVLSGGGFFYEKRPVCPWPECKLLKQLAARETLK